MCPEVEFDHVAPIYDETRRPPSDAELDRLVELLNGCHSLLDGGVGTGRFAAPLHARGFDVLGVDLSLEMMRRARSKGVTALARADLRHLPIQDQAVDAAFTAHVLQLVADPAAVLREFGRVTRRKVVVLLPERPFGGPGDARVEFYRRYRSVARELGYSLPERGPRFWHTLEDLQAIAPPAEVRVVEGQPPALTEEAMRRRREAGWFGRGTIPPEVHEEILRRLGAENISRPSWGRGQRIERFIVWDSSALRAVR